MAKNSSDDSTVAATVSSTDTKYVSEKAPSLPTANLSVTREDPVIDQRLIDIRNAEAKAMADRFSK